MADEAVVRIVLQSDDRAATTAPAPAPSTKPNAPPPASNYIQPPPVHSAASSPVAPPPTTIQPTPLVNQGTSPQAPTTTQPALPTPVQKPPQNTTQPPPTNPEWMESLIAPKRGATPLDDANPHVLVEGQSGSGKSMATRHIAMERMKRGEEVRVADQHTPQSWGGAKEVYQGQTAGKDAAKAMLDTLKERIRLQSEATLKGEKIDFKPITFVLSDFARLMRETPQMQDALKSLLTEGRKFRIGILADTTALTGAASGIKGINDVRNNFGQRAQFYPPTADEGRQARIGGTGGEFHDVPQLPDYKDKYDPSLVKSATATDLNAPVGAAAAAHRKFEKEKYDAEVEAEYLKLNPPKPPEPPPAFDPMEVARQRVEREEQRAAVEAEYDKLKPPPPPKPDPPFDPVEQARKRVEKENQRAAVDAEYAKLKPQANQTKSNLDHLLDAAESMRGAIGGTFGKVAGVALDLTHKFRAARDKAEKNKPDPAQLPAQEKEDNPNWLKAVNIPPPKAEPLSDDDREKRKGTTEPAPVAKIAPPEQPKSDKPTNEVKELGTAAAESKSSMAMLAPAVGIATAAFIGLTNALDASIQRYSDVSPDIAQAQALAEVNKTMNDMRRAQEHGADLAKYVEAQARMQERFEEAKMRLLTKLAPIAEAIFEILGGIATVIGGFMDAIDIIVTPIKWLIEIVNKIFRLLEKDTLETTLINDPTDLLYKGDPGDMIPEV